MADLNDCTGPFCLAVEFRMAQEASHKVGRLVLVNSQNHETISRMTKLPVVESQVTCEER